MDIIGYYLIEIVFLLIYLSMLVNGKVGVFKKIFLFVIILMEGLLCVCLFHYGLLLSALDV